MGEPHPPKLNFHFKGRSPQKSRTIILTRGLLRRLRRAARKISAATSKKEVAVLIFFALLLIGYIAIWGLTSLVSVKKPQEPRVREIVVKRYEEARKEAAGPRIPKISARVAIVLDDAGGDFVNYSEIYSIREPFTISVLPNLKNSGKVAREAVAAGKEAILHLPMQPENYAYVRTDGGMILDTMSDETIRQVVFNDLLTVPGVVGANNHMGSKATKDARVVLDFLEALREKGLFFIDSRTAHDSIAYRLARENGIKSGRNEVFLDVLDSEEAVGRKLGELISLARRDGSSIGIGHATRPATIAALKKLMPIYEKEGIRFVPVSSLVK